eukprot:CCRYP_014207-RA/>CCRYP_014207-RA protein AED:0.03 eAED:0.03 QI:142/1/1/1/1/1/2/128/543
MAQQNKISSTNSNALWKCDFCHKAVFDTSVAADEHEKSCSARPSNENDGADSTENGGDKEARITQEPEATNAFSRELRSGKVVSASKGITFPIDQLPKDVTSRFGEGGFVRYGNGNTWVPILEISPSDVEDTVLTAKWSKMFEKWTDKKGELHRTVFWYNGDNSRFALLPQSKIITYEEGKKVGICKVSKKLTSKLDQKKPLATREQGLVEFLNDMKTSKQDRIAKCIARAKKLPLQPPTKPTAHTNEGVQEESNPQKCAKTKAADTSINSSPPKKAKPNDPVLTEVDQVLVTPEKVSTEKDDSLQSPHTSGFQEKFLKSLSGGNEQQEQNHSQLFQQIYDLIVSNYAILSRLREFMKTGSIIGSETTFVRSYFNKVKIIRSMEMIKFVTTPILEEKVFDMQSLKDLPNGLNFFNVDFFIVEGLIDFGKFLDYSQLLEERVRLHILSLLKGHVIRINTHLQEIETWVVERKCPIGFFQSYFDQREDSGFHGNEYILVEKRMEPNIQSFIKGLRLREWEGDEEYDLSNDAHLDELMGVVHFVAL